MKISCDIIEDLLPLYHDNVCSKDTKKTVAEHLKQCENCRTVLAMMDENLEEKTKIPDDEQIFKLLQNAWNKGTTRSFKRGFRIGTIVICSITLILLTVFFVPIPRYYDVTYTDVYHIDGSKAEDVTINVKFWDLYYLTGYRQTKGSVTTKNNAFGNETTMVFDTKWPDQLDKNVLKHKREEGYTLFSKKIQPAIIPLYLEYEDPWVTDMHKYSYGGTFSYDETLNNFMIDTTGDGDLETGGLDQLYLASADGSDYQTLCYDLFFFWTNRYLDYLAPRE